MKLLIDIPEEIYKASKIIDVQYEDVVQIPLDVVANGTPISDNATNGKVITAMFPNAKIVETDREVFLYTGTRKKDEDIQIFDTEWWNAPYWKGGNSEYLGGELYEDEFENR